MKLKITILLAFIVLSFSLSAQKIFEKGYIITNEMDTLYGFIANNSYAKNATYCEFKTNENDEVQKLNPGDIHSYQFSSGKYYISKEVKFSELSLNVFLEYLIKGKLNIYYLRFNGADIYFAQKENDEIYYLENKERYFDYDITQHKWVSVENKNIQKVANSERYKGLLTFFTQEVPALKNQIENASLSHKSLVKIAKEYHYEICEGEDCVIYEKKEKPWFTLGLVQGYSYNPKLSEISKNYVDYKVGGVNYPGIEINTQFLKAGERINFKVQLYFYDANTRYETQYHGENIETVYFKVPIMFGYNFKINNFNPYVNAGVSFVAVFKYEYTTYDLMNGEPLNYAYYDKEYFSRYSKAFGGVVSAGVKYNLKSYYMDLGFEYDYYGKLHSQNMFRPRIGIGYQFN